MPIFTNSNIDDVTQRIPVAIRDYNNTNTAYNTYYENFINARNSEIDNTGSLSKWLATREAGEAISSILSRFGMNARKSKLNCALALNNTLAKLPANIVDFINQNPLPLPIAPSGIVNPVTGASLSKEIMQLYELLYAQGAITDSGGFVAASKTMHFLFPQLCPMIDGAHTGLSYYNINELSYVPPFPNINWSQWIGQEINRKLNPSPRGGGRHSWKAAQYIAAIGINQKIYSRWNDLNENAGVAGFISLDPTLGTTGIPRVLDKILW